MPTAVPINRDIGPQPEPNARLYRLEPPITDSYDHVVVWVEPAQAHLPSRAVAIPTNERGASTQRSMRPVAEYSHPYEPNHAGVLWLLGGYDIGEEETPEDPPRAESGAPGITPDMGEGT